MVGPTKIFFLILKLIFYVFYKVIMIKFLTEIYVNIKSNLVKANWTYLSNVNTYLESSFVCGKA